MANKVVYLKWGTRYTDEHVAALYDKVKNNCSVDFDFITMDHVHISSAFKELEKIQKEVFRGTQDPESSITDNPLQDYIREDAGGFAHFRKYIMFLKDIEYCEEDDTLLYLDLDTVIKKDLAYFFDLELNKPWIARSWQFNENMKWNRLYSLRSCPYYNSSVLLWKPGQCRKIFNQMMKNSYANFFQYGACDNWLFHRFGPYAYDENHKNYFNTFDRGIVASDKNSLSDNTIIHTLAGLDMDEKNKICLT